MKRIAIAAMWGLTLAGCGSEGTEPGDTASNTATTPQRPAYEIRTGSVVPDATAATVDATAVAVSTQRDDAGTSNGQARMAVADLDATQRQAAMGTSAVTPPNVDTGAASY